MIVYCGADGCNWNEDGKCKKQRETMGDYIENTKINLCDTCKQTYPECPVVGDDITFGDGVGSDNICKCRFYEADEES